MFSEACIYKTEFYENQSCHCKILKIFLLVNFTADGSNIITGSNKLKVQVHEPAKVFEDTLPAPQAYKDCRKPMELKLLYAKEYLICYNNPLSSKRCLLSLQNVACLTKVLQQIAQEELSVVGKRL